MLKGLNLSRRPKFTKIVNPECKLKLNMLLLQLCPLVILVWTPDAQILQSKDQDLDFYNKREEDKSHTLAFDTKKRWDGCMTWQKWEMRNFTVAVFSMAQDERI